MSEPSQPRSAGDDGRGALGPLLDHPAPPAGLYRRTLDALVQRHLLQPPPPAGLRPGLLALLTGAACFVSGFGLGTRRAVPSGAAAPAEQSTPCCSTAPPTAWRARTRSTPTDSGPRSLPGRDTASRRRAGRDRLVLEGIPGPRGRCRDARARAQRVLRGERTNRGGGARNRQDLASLPARRPGGGASDRSHLSLPRIDTRRRGARFRFDASPPSARGAPRARPTPPWDEGPSARMSLSRQ